MKDLISIIVPVYNVEAYLERCVKSLINQTYSNLEIILVDDGSIDNSGKICEKLALTDNRIRVIHQNNQGLGPARNSGLAVCQGKYVAFVDSDDWVETCTYDYMHEKMIQNNCDIVTCGRKIVTDSGFIKEVYCSVKPRKLTAHEAVRQYLLQKEMNMAAWDKLYLTSLFKEVRFPGGFVSEDIVPIYTVLKNSKGVFLTGKPFYNYYYRIGSLSRSAFTPKLMGAFTYSQIVVEDIKHNIPSLTEEANFYEYDQIITVYRAIRRSGYNGKESQELFHLLKNNLNIILRNNYLLKRQKIYALLAVLGFDILPDKLYKAYKNIRMIKK